MLSVGWSSWASKEKLVFTGEVSLLDLGAGVELRSCFRRAFCVWVSGCWTEPASKGMFLAAGSEPFPTAVFVVIMGP